MRTAVAVCLLTSLAMAQSAKKEAPQTTRHPTPDAAAIKEARAGVREIFREDFDRAKKPAELTALAARLTKVAAGTLDDPVSQYALLLESQQLATEAVHLDGALAAIAEIEKRFVGNCSHLKADVIEHVAEKTRTSEQGRVAEHAMQFAQQAAAANDFTSAERMLKIAQSSGRKARNLPLVRAAADLQKVITAQAAAFAEVTQAMAVLETNPADPQANFQVGHYLCLQTGDWSAGLKHLAAGGEGKLQTLAKEDLANREAPSNRAKLAGEWWKLAEESEPPARRNLKLRAVHWYTLALPKLSGITKQLAVKRVAEMNSEVAEATITPRSRECAGQQRRTQ